MRRVAALAATACALAACTPAEHRAARETYNKGVDLLAKGDYDGAEKALLDARSNAGVDPELRFRAAYDLGLAYAAHADKAKTGQDADLGKALSLERQAVSWFTDAAQLRKDDADATANLAIVRARAAALADELDRDKGTLEARLDSVIDAQRELLASARAAWAQTKQTGGADPLALSKPLGELADRERGVVADAGVVSDLAADEIDSIGKKPEDKRTQEEKVRVVQLKNLDVYVESARGKIAEARRALQDLDADGGTARAEAALVALKRAREQLLDPVALMREIARDQLELYEETAAVAQARGKPLLGIGMSAGSGAGSANAGSADAGSAAPLVPEWLEPPALAEREGTLHDRLDEMRARVQAGVDNAAAPQGSDAAPPKLTPEQQKTLDHITAALPHVTAATLAMTRSRDALGGTQLADAGTAERAALDELAKAIEEFADLKQTIDLAYETQQQIVKLLSPESKDVPNRADETTRALDGNISRMDRIKEQLADEVAKLDAQAQQLDAKAAAAGSGSGAPDPKQLDAAKEQLAQAKQQLTTAETLRGEAAAALAEIQPAIAHAGDPLAKATAAEQKLDDLRKIFFSVIEHLQELIREQGETRDKTATAGAQDDFTRGPALPHLVEQEAEHAHMAQAITDALAKQADAAQKQKGPQPQQGPDAKALAAAADEVRQGKIEMDNAKSAIDKAAKSTTQTVPLEPAVDGEAKAIEHLQKALALLQPPQQNQQKKQDQKQQQQQQQQQKQQKQPKQDQQKQDQQKGLTGQRALDQDAERQREKREQQRTEPTDEDW